MLNAGPMKVCLIDITTQSFTLLGMVFDIVIVESVSIRYIRYNEDMCKVFIHWPLHYIHV